MVFLAQFILSLTMGSIIEFTGETVTRKLDMQALSITVTVYGENSIDINLGPKIGPKIGPRCKIENTV